MRKAYILVYSSNLGVRSVINECLNSLPEIETWRYDMPNSYYIISEYTASEIANAIRKKIPNGRFLVSEIETNRQGWLSKDTWDFIKKKGHK